MDVVITGCLATGREDGIVEVWDLLDRSHEPVISCTVSMAMVTSLSFSTPDEQPDSSAKPASHKQYLAVGKCIGYGVPGQVSPPAVETSLTEGRAGNAAAAPEAGPVPEVCAVMGAQPRKVWRVKGGLPWKGAAT